MHLPFAYVHLAKSSGYDTLVSEECVAKLRAMSNEPADEFYNSFNFPVALARHFSNIGNKIEAKKAIMKQFKTAIDLLSDDDPENDWLGYLLIGCSVSFAGDVDNAMAAISLITPAEINGELPDEDDKPADASITPKDDLEPLKDSTPSVTVTAAETGTQTPSSEQGSTTAPEAPAETPTPTSTERSTDSQDEKGDIKTTNEPEGHYNQPFKGPM